MVHVADELVGSVSCLAGLAVEQGVGEAGDVAGGDPGLGVHEDGGVEADVVLALLHELLEPCLLHVVLELHAEGTVVPGVCKPAVDLAARVYKAAVLAQRYDFVHCLFVVFHFSFTSFPTAGRRRDFNNVGLWAQVGTWSSAFRQCTGGDIPHTYAGGSPSGWSSAPVHGTGGDIPPTYTGGSPSGWSSAFGHCTGGDIPPTCSGR